MTTFIHERRERPLKLPVVLLLATYLLALMGRFTLDRVGIMQLAEFDLRLFIAPLIAVAILAWRLRPDVSRQDHTWAFPVRWALALFGYLALTGCWALFGARIEEQLADIGVLAFLVVAMVVVSAADPERSRRIILLALLATALVYAAGGLLLGQTNVQGRSAAFGGGPNVYVRVVLLGIIASIVLAIVYRRKLFLLYVPVLAAAALLAGSRGGIAAALATALVFFVLCWRRLSGRAVAAAVIGVIAVIAAVLAISGPEEVGLLQERFIADLFQQGQFSGRPELFTETFGIFLSQPIFGAGLDAFWVEFGVSQALDYPHNILLEIGSAGGMIGLTLLVGCALSTGSALLGARHDVVKDTQFALLMGALLIAVASLSSGDLYDSRFMWIFLALAVNTPFTPRRISVPGRPVGREEILMPDRFARQ